MYKIKTNKMIIFLFFSFYFFGIFISLCHIFLKTKQNKNTNKHTKSRTSSWPILEQTDRYYQCPKLNTFIVWTYVEPPIFDVFVVVLLFFILFCFFFFVLFCFFVFVFVFNLIFGGGRKPNAPPPPSGGADLKHGARRCEYLKTHFHVRLSCCLQGTHFMEKSWKVIWQDPLWEKIGNFNPHCHKF